MFLLVIKELCICLIITIVVEYIPIVIFLQIPKKYYVAVNVLTNVVANVILNCYDILNIKSAGLISREKLFISLEIIVCMVEILLYYKKLSINEVRNNSDNIKLENKIRNNNRINKLNVLKLCKITAITVLANILSVVLGNMILERIYV